MLLCKNKAKKWSDFILRDNKLHSRQTLRILKMQKIWEAWAKSMMKSCTNWQNASYLFPYLWNMKEISEFIFLFVFIYFPIMNALVFFDYKPGHSLGGKWFRTKWKKRKSVGFHILTVLEGVHWNISFELGTLDIYFRQNTTFIKVRLDFVFVILVKSIN